MFKKLSALSLCLFISLTANFAQPSTCFHTTGANLYDPCGNQITLRGLNYAVYNWGNDANEILFREVAKTGANCVRITWYVNDPNTAAIYTPANLGRAIDSCLANKMIPIIELHDKTCQNDHPGLISLTNYYTTIAIKNVLIARQKKIILNLANESLFVMWTGNAAAAETSYRQTYTTIVTNLRGAGYHCPLMIDASDCGQHSDLFSNVATPLITSDPDHNLIFSAHSYWFGYANTTAAIQTKLQSMVAANIPFVLGEVANQQDDQQNCQYTLDYQTILQEATTRGIGWLAWSWNRDVCPNRQVSSTGNFANLTTYGSAIVNSTATGLKYKAVRTPYMLNNFICPVATDNAENSTKEPVLYTHSASWEFVLENNSATKTELYDLNGRLISVFTTENNMIEVQKPLISGLYIIVLSNKEGVFYRKKVWDCGL
jgi:mannan endo-1,4-beta-mannosidase